MPDHSAPTQATVLDRLGEVLGHDGAVQRIDTHASIILLAGRRALKIKRDIRLPYLDYSSLEKRRAACERELAINRPHAPQIYRRVVAITCDEAGHWQIGGAGRPVEWALEMARFDDALTLDHLARSGPIDDAFAIELADAIARSHRNAERAEQSAWALSVPELIALNTSRFRHAAQFKTGDVERLDQASMNAFAAARDRLARRAAEGFVRRCHGDLHLANIVAIDGRPVLFDAIEFSDDLATTDVLYDLAFPITDLIHHGQAQAASVVLNRYLSSMGGAVDGLFALPLFMSLRAAIRAQVLLTRHQQKPDDGVLASAQAYFDLARRLIDPAPPRLIAIGGLSGTGKSALARTLAAGVAPPPGAIVLRSDVIRKTMFGVDQTTPLPQSAYEHDVSERVYRSLADMAGRVLSQGLSVIADAAFLRPDQRRAIEQAAGANGAPFQGLFLTADLATRLARIASRRDDASDADADVARQQERFDAGSVDWDVIDAAGSPEQTVAAAQARMTRR